MAKKHAFSPTLALIRSIGQLQRLIVSFEGDRPADTIEITHRRSNVDQNKITLSLEDGSKLIVSIEHWK